MKQLFSTCALLCVLLFSTLRLQAQSVNVTLTIDEGTAHPAILTKAAHNISQVLSEINRAQAAGSVLTTKNLPMNDFALKSLLRLWAVTPFYIDDEEVVERCWMFSNGSMQVSHVPLIITPVDENFGVGTYQEAVIECDRNGIITDFRLALDAHMAESMERCGGVVDKERQMIIMQYIERFRTAYNQRDINFINQIFSGDALIITGKVVTARTGNANAKWTQKVTYTKQSKQQYLRNLRMAFARNKWIDVQFSEIGEHGEGGGCAGITRSLVNPNMYGVRLRQHWKSSNYSDEGYLFLLWEFPDNGGDPTIHVRTWQPQWVNGQKQTPDDDISTLGAFDL